MSHVTTPAEPGQSSRRLTLGFLNYNLWHSLELQIWQGVMDKARERGVNLICFIGDQLQSPFGFRAHANVLYDLVSAERIDGVAMFAAAMGVYLNQEEKMRFFTRYLPLPTVLLEEQVDSLPCIDFDFAGSLRQLLIHLLDHHGYRKIAFARGPDTHHVAELRYRVYQEILAEHDIPFDPALVTPPGVWDQATGRQAVQTLIDQRRVIPEAILAASDDIALGVMAALQDRQFRVPDEIAVVGHDDVAESKWITPPLTTVPNRAYEQGQMAIEALLAQMAGEPVPSHVVVPLSMVVRQSCGCQDSKIEHASSRQAQELTVDARDPAAMREAILAAMTPTIAQTARHSAWMRSLIEAFFNDLSRAGSGGFLSTLRQILGEVAVSHGDITDWHQPLSVLRRQGLCALQGDLLRRNAEDLLQQARVMIGEFARRVQGHHVLQMERQAEMLHDIESQLISTFDLAELMTILAEELPRLGISGCYLSVYEHPAAPTGMARLLLAYTAAGRIALPPDGHAFPAPQLVPDELLRLSQPYSLIAFPLYFRERQLGLILFEASSPDGTMYETLRTDISSALQGAMLVRQVREHAKELANQKYVLDTFMENVPDFIYFKDRQSRLTKINRALARRMGIRHPDEVIGQGDFDFFPEEQALRKYEQEQEIIRTGEPLVSLEEPDGDGHWALTTKMPLRDEQGEIIGTFGISHDITPLKTAQQEIERAYAEIRTLNEQLKQENLRMSAELDVARRLQAMVLPSAGELQHLDGIDLTGFMQPADEVGGDYYDILPCGDQRICIGIGDVTGHGLESGILMLMTQTAIRTLVESNISDPICFLGTLNRVLYKNIQRMRADKSLSLSMVRYEKGRLTIIGQHEEVIIVRQEGRIETVSTTGLGFPIGLMEDISALVREATVQLAPGDGIVLYTDGITEAENAAHQLYGLDRLCAVIQAHWHLDSTAIKQAVIEDVLRHIGSETVYDDVTLIVLKQR